MSEISTATPAETHEPTLPVQRMKSTRARVSGCSRLVAVMGAVLVAGCTLHKPFRTSVEGSHQLDHEVCKAAPGQDCRQASLIDLNSSLLGIVEFDDLGWYWNRKQKDAVVRTIEELAASEDLVLVVFAHGWNHSASAGDTNLRDFETVLANLEKLERRAAELKCQKPRRVVGLYLAWRGKAFLRPSKFPGCLYNWTSFWTRKKAAHSVGGEDAVELLRDVERIRDQAHRVRPEAERATRLVVAGHSFGSAVVYGALSRILAERRTELTPGSVSNADFGDLVMLVNPAIEASLLFPFQAASQAATTARQSDALRSADFHPILAVFSSQGDGATGTTFLLGRWISTLLKKHRRDIPQGYQGPNHFQGVAARQAVGHFKPTISHLLCPKGEERDGTKIACTRSKFGAAGQGKESALGLAPVGTEQLEEQLRALKEAQDLAAGFAHGDQAKLPLYTADLIALKPGNAMSPYPVISVDKRLIKGHNDIFSEWFSSFLVEFVAVWDRSIPVSCGQPNAWESSSSGGSSGVEWSGNGSQRSATSVSEPARGVLRNETGTGI